METMKVLPVDGARVRDPETNELLSDKGATVPRNTFWLRRLSDGSVKLPDKKPLNNKKGE